MGKLIVAYLIKNFREFYGTQRFITTSTEACHWTLSSTWRILLFKSILVLLFYIGRDPQVDSTVQNPWQKHACTRLISSMGATCSTHLNCIPLIIWWRVQYIVTDEVCRSESSLVKVLTFQRCLPNSLSALTMEPPPWESQILHYPFVSSTVVFF